MTLRQFFAIVEIRTKIVSLSTYTLASLYVLFRTGRLDPIRASFMLVATLLVDMGTTGFNTFFDYRSGVDSARFNREESKVVVHEGVPWGLALVTSMALFGLAIPFGITLAFLSGWPVVVIGALCMAVGFFYTGGPKPFSRTPTGEIFAGGALGSVLFLLIYYIHAGVPDLEALLVSLPSSLLIASILTVNNTCDIDGDRAAGRRTLSIILGRKGGETLAVVEALSGFGFLVVLCLWGPFPAWASLATVPFVLLAMIEFSKMHKKGYGHHTKGSSMESISRIFLFFTLATTVVLLMAIIT